MADVCTKLKFMCFTVFYGEYNEFSHSSGKWEKEGIYIEFDKEQTEIHIIGDDSIEKRMALDGITRITSRMTRMELTELHRGISLSIPLGYISTARYYRKYRRCWSKYN